VRSSNLPARAAEIQPQPVEWVIQDSLPRRVITLVVGPRNSGKSLLAVHWAAEITKGSDRVPEPGRVWLNSTEDDLRSVTRPRCEIAGADLERIRLSDKAYRFPQDIGCVEEVLMRLQAKDELPDLVIFDSLSLHVPRFTSPTVVSEAFARLLTLGQELCIGFAFVHHFIKSVRSVSTVEAAIGGAGAIQGLAKAVYVLMPEPHKAISVHPTLDEADAGPVRRVLACERMGIAPSPPSLAYRLETKFSGSTDRDEPHLVFDQETKYSSEQLMQEARLATGSSREEESRVHDAAVGIIEVLDEAGSMPTQRLVEVAKDNGFYFSRNTFDRARQLADVESIRPSELEEKLGSEFVSGLTDDERRVFWVRRRSEEPPMDQWKEEADLPE
jgi:KaiC/GvpD/RAD55 family RecA-like ATPase